MFRCTKWTAGFASAVTASLVIGTGSAVADETPPPRDFAAGVCADSPDSDFNDVPDGYYAEEAVNCLAASGLVNGYVDGTFRPSIAVDRAGAAAFIGRLAEQLTFEAVFDSNEQPPFQDLDGVPEEKQFYIRGLYNRDVIEGRTRTTFAPGESLTRGQVATLLSRTHGLVQREAVGPAPSDLPEGQDYFSDDDGSVHEQAVERLAAAGVVQGIGGGAYAPERSVTRAQLVLILARYLQFVEDATQ